MKAWEGKLTPLFLGLTRPAMVGGVSLPFFVLNGVANLILFLATLSWLPLLIVFPAMQIIGWLGCQYEPRWVSLCQGRLLFLYCPNRHYWGANSYDPIQ